MKIADGIWNWKNLGGSGLQTQFANSCGTVDTKAWRFVRNRMVAIKNFDRKSFSSSSKNNSANTAIPFLDTYIFVSPLVSENAAFTVPGVGIFASIEALTNLNLLYHEYGHILQAEMWGLDFYFDVIAPTSVESFNKQKNTNYGYNHDWTWTEWTASRLSYYTLNPPFEWADRQYPYNPRNAYFPYTSKANEAKLYMNIFLMFNKK